MNKYWEEKQAEFYTVVPQTLIQDMSLIYPTRAEPRPIAVIVALEDGSANYIHCLDAETFMPIQNDLQLVLFARAYAEKAVWDLERRQAELDKAHTDYTTAAEEWQNLTQPGASPPLPFPEEADIKAFFFYMGRLCQLSLDVLSSVDEMIELTQPLLEKPSLLYLDEVFTLQNTFRFLLRDLARLETFHHEFVDEFVYSDRFPLDEVNANEELKEFLAKFAITELTLDKPGKVSINEIEAAIDTLALQIRKSFSENK